MMKNETQTTPERFHLPRSLKLVMGQSMNGLPNPDLLSYYVLEAQRVLYLDGEVCDDTKEIHRMILRWNMEDEGIPREERRPIRLYIDSPGGDVYTMWMLIDAIMASETPVYTVNVGSASSAAALIFIAGEKRFMTPHARVLIHEGSAQMMGDAVKVLDASENYRRTVRQMREFILARTDIPASTLTKQKNHDWELDAAYCLAHGVCDTVVERLGQIA